MITIPLPTKKIECFNWVRGSAIRGSGEAHEIKSPYNGAVIGRVFHSTRQDVDEAVKIAQKAASVWGSVPVKERCQVLFRVREILLRDLESNATIISAESGKILSEAKAGLLKGIEVLEFALSLQNTNPGERLEVSRGVFCEARREPLGVVAGITPFNFPAMVPMWMIPIALAVGNSFVWKPSDKTPLTSLRLAYAFHEAGLPAGVLTIVQGAKATVDALIENPGISAIGFVGSTPVARQVYQKGTSLMKRVLALGGAKNHIILMPDADPELSAKGITDSFTGCAGQRCMAASVLLAVGEVDSVIERITSLAQNLRLGLDMGALISADSRSHLHRAIEKANEDGARIRLDGRKANPPPGCEGGNWLGPTILDFVDEGSEAARDELFGPVLSVIRCKNLTEALSIENKNPYGNAASVFTTNGGIAERVAREARSGMIGVNIGVPVPREPFSFGGIAESKFGHGDITGWGGVDLWSNLRKVTVKWSQQAERNWMS